MKSTPSSTMTASPLVAILFNHCPSFELYSLSTLGRSSSSLNVRANSCMMYLHTVPIFQRWLGRFRSRYSSKQRRQMALLSTFALVFTSSSVLFPPRFTLTVLK